MFTIHNLLQQLQGMGLDPQGNLGNITGSDVATALGGQYGIPDLLSSQMFQTINPELIKSASLGAFSPLMQQGQQSFQTDLIQNLSGGQARQAMGNFAGSGSAQLQQTQARDVYGKSMQDVLAQAVTGRGQATGNIQNIINQWQETAQSFT
tara:strand:- start:6098 stop:6550 length:453 start_codon:yes stop_codon:yes gene_type:complete